MTIVFFGIISIACHFYLTQKIYTNAPQEPNYASGEVVKVNEHGKIFYVTEQNNTLNFVSIPVGIGFIMLATFVSRAWKHSDKY